MVETRHRGDTWPLGPNSNAGASLTADMRDRYYIDARARTERYLIMKSIASSCFAFLKTRRLWWRAFWAMMLLFHAPATLAALMSLGGGESAGLSQCLLLLTSNLFFIFELIFVSSLRLLQDRRCALVLLLIIALIHTGIIERGLPASDIMGSARPLLFFAMIGAMGGVLLTFARTIASRLTTIVADWRRLLISRRRYAYATVPASSVRRPQCGWRSSPLRAPPFI